MKQSRYSRQILFSQIGEKGQERLGNSQVLIVGMGALGTVLANHLVRAGIGHVRFIDRDFVEESNLQRQMLFDEQDVADRMPKAIAAERKLKMINSEVKIEGIVGDLTALNIHDLASGMDIILDGTDNFKTRFIINDFCFQNKIPYVYGGAVGARGMQATFIPDQTACLRCLIDDNGGAAETCDTSGVLAPVIDLVASHQALDAVKYLVGEKDKIRTSLISIDLWQNYTHEIKLTKVKANCLTCQTKEFPALQVNHEDYITTLCGRETVQISRPEGTIWDLNEWEQRLGRIAKTERNPFLLRVYIESFTMVLFPDGRVLIQGTEDITVAKSLYAKYIGL